MRNCKFYEKLAYWYRYRKWVLVPMDRDKVVPVPKVSGTDTNQSGTNTDASRSPDFYIHALLSLNSYIDSMGTLIND